MATPARSAATDTQPNATVEGLEAVRAVVAGQAEDIREIKDTLKEFTNELRNEMRTVTKESASLSAVNELTRSVGTVSVDLAKYAALAQMTQAQVAMQATQITALQTGQSQTAGGLKFAHVAAFVVLVPVLSTLLQAVLQVVLHK